MNTGSLPPPLPCPAMNCENSDTNPECSETQRGETVNNRYNGLWAEVVMCQHQLCTDILHFIVIILDTKTRWIVVNEW